MPTLSTLLEELQVALDEVTRERDQLQSQLDAISKAMSVAGLLKQPRCHFCQSPIPKGQQHIFDGEWVCSQCFKESWHDLHHPPHDEPVPDCCDCGG